MKMLWVGDLPVVKISPEWVTGPYIETGTGKQVAQIHEMMMMMLL